VSKYSEAFIPETYYHIFDRANGDELLFKSEENYNFFHIKMKKYLLPYFEFQAYCLLPNHFHFVVKTKSIEEVQKLLPEITADNFNKKYLQNCSNFLNSYAKSYNKYHKRMGSLFIERMKRVQIKTNQEIINAIFYVHKNPVHHGLVPSLSDWNNSSYKIIKNGLEDDFISPESVLRLFGGIVSFNKVHDSSYLSPNQ